MWFKQNKSLIITALIFGIIYSLISIVNHYNFRTYALDLGAYTNALYDYIHFQWNDSTVFKEVSENLLADHFDLYLIIFSPLVLIFGSYTLLIVQIFFILLGGIGVHRYFENKNARPNIPIFATLYFYLFFGIFSAISFDYHSNVIAACLVPWFFYFFEKRKYVSTTLVLIFILIAKENMPLWMAFICLGLLIGKRKGPVLSKRYLGLAFLGCVCYFLIVTSVIMPKFANNSLYPHFHYSFLGNSYFEAITYLIKHPFESFKVLFTNHTNDIHGDFVKAELHILLLISGLPLLIKKPHYILMLLPIYFQKLFHDNISMWGINAQYSIEFAPILAIGVFSVINDFKNKKAFQIASIAILVLTLASTIRIMDSTVYFTEKSKIRFYQGSHYSRDYSVKEIHKELSKIPKDAIVSSQSPFLPHLANRDNVYQFPMIKDADFIVYSTKENLYPLDSNSFKEIAFEIENSKNWTINYQQDGFVVLQKSNYSK